MGDQGFRLLRKSQKPDDGLEYSSRNGRIDQASHCVHASGPRGDNSIQKVSILW